MSSRSIEDLHALFRPRVEQWMDDCERAGLVILITCTLRTEAEQAALYCIGRTVPGNSCIPVIRPMGLTVTRAKPGQSAHQYGCGLDFVPMDCGKPVWTGTGKLWDTAIRLAEARGLESLRPMESAHLQHPSWQAIALDMVHAPKVA